MKPTLAIKRPMLPDGIPANAVQATVLLLSNLSPLIPLWTGRKQKSILWHYAWICLAFDLIGLILKTLHIERLWASNLFFLAEFLLISAYFIREVFNNSVKKIYRISVVILAVLFLFQTIVHSVWKPNYIGAAVFYGVYILYTFIGLLTVIREIEYIKIEQSSLFIFCVAFLIYASGSFIILLFENELLHINKDFIYNAWRFVRNPLNIFKNLMTGYGLYLHNKQKQRAKPF